MKKTISSFIAFLLSLVLIGCSTGCNNFSHEHSETTDDTTQRFEYAPDPIENYEIVSKDGQYYIVFEEETGISNGGVQLSSIPFSSLKELKDTILEKKFSQAQLNTIKNIFPKDANGIMICNPNQLYEPILPSEMQIREVHLNGVSYFFAIEETSVANGFFVYYTNEEYQEVFKRDYEEYFFNPLMYITDRTQVPDRDAVITYYNTSMVELKTIQYQVGDLYILEDYTLSCTFAGGLTVSDTVPTSVKIYGKKNGLCFVLYLHGFEERPTVEWLSSFAIREFSDNSHEVK